mgnify:CR=1 FL=1
MKRDAGIALLGTQAFCMLIALIYMMCATEEVDVVSSMFAFMLVSVVSAITLANIKDY